MITYISQATQTEEPNLVVRVKISTYVSESTQTEEPIRMTAHRARDRKMCNDLAKLRKTNYEVTDDICNIL